MSFEEIVLIKPGYWKSPGSLASQVGVKGTCGDAFDLPWQCDVDGKTCDAREGKYYDECGVLKTIMPCLNEKACIGTKAANYSNNTCDYVNGYRGPMCQTCDTQRGFFMTSNGCDTCSNKIHPTIRLGIVLVCLLICGLIAKKVMSKLNKHRKYDVMIRHLTELIVVVFDFMQIAGSMSSLYSVRMPSYLKKFLSDANIVNFDIVDMLGLNCLGQDVTFYASFTLVSTVPVMVLVLCWIGYISTTHYARLKVKMLKSEKMGWGRLIRRISLVQQKQRDRRARFLVIGLSTLSLLYMPLTVRCFRFFQCIYVGKSLYCYCCYYCY